MIEKIEKELEIKWKWITKNNAYCLGNYESPDYKVRNI